MLYRDRVDAGQRLAQALLPLRSEHPVVLGLPRGGVPVAAEIARVLSAPLDVIMVRKLGLPGHSELAMGAIGEGGVRIVNEEVVRAAGVDSLTLARVEQLERTELERRARQFRGKRRQAPLAGRTAVIVDDGIATGSTARAACQVVRELGAARVVLAVPVGAAGAIRELRADADDVLCLETPARFRAVGEWYADFDQTTDEDVIRLLQPPADADTPATPPSAHGCDALVASRLRIKGQRP